LKSKQNIPEYSVSEFNNLIRDMLESNYSFVRIRGEISEIKSASKGQLYITIKDENSILSSVIWGNKINHLSIEPEIGMEIIASGKITTWSRFKTTYQLDIDNLELAGEGALLKLIEERKKRLFEKGIFDQKYKKKLPYIPNKIGIITSPTGAVIYDIINRLKDRFPIKVDLWPVVVQGKEAPEMIVEAIKGFNEKSYLNKPEVIIIARGGGSVEDLMAFNDEILALEVFKSKIPVVSAIGHETDNTIIDFVSDVRAATPTASVELVVPVRKELILEINRWSDRLINSIKNKFKNSLNNYNHKISLLKDPFYAIDKKSEKLININKDLINYFKYNIINKKNILEFKILKLKSPVQYIKEKKYYSINLFKSLELTINQKISKNILLMKNAIRLLNSNSIDQNLKKGYVLVKKNNKIVKRSKNIKSEDNIKIKFYDNQLKVKIKKIN
tara:strand:+ start:2348 stop:3682 length:1335 start_codon:yes stop_codon:yes gene_type:complete